MATPARPSVGSPPVSRGPLLLSAFVMPGLGQAVQRRWGAAIGFGTAFLLTVGVFLKLAWTILNAYYGIAFGHPHSQPPDLPLHAFALVATLGVVIYLAGLLDTWRAYLRACRARRGVILPPPLADSVRTTAVTATMPEG